jgi:hypothetical protein
VFTAYFIVDGSAEEPAGLQDLLRREAIPLRPRPLWVPPASTPHPLEWVHALWAGAARHLRRTRDIRARRVLDGFLVIVVTGQSTERSISEALRAAQVSFGARRTLLLLLDDPAHPTQWFARPAELAGTFGCRVSLGAIPPPTASA